MTNLKKYWMFTLIGTLAVSVYPIYMGISVVYNMATEGTLYEENFPKYIIPYTPIAIAVIFSVILMPLLVKLAKRLATLAASVLSVGVFFAAELLFESKVIVTTTVTTTLESWQMYMCAVVPTTTETRKWQAIDVLLGEYSPTFKIHFYLISVVLIIAIINCLYGFAGMIGDKDKSRCKTLAVQSVCTAVFLGLCILACFTAFFRDGELTVSALSAFLMILFFAVLGITVGTYIGSFLLGRGKLISVAIPSATASLAVIAMYIGEMFLLNGHLYRFGEGFLFDGIPMIVLSPVDVLVVVLSGCANAVICYLLNRKKH